MATLTIELTPEMEEMIAERLKEGPYKTADEVCHAALESLRLADAEYNEKREYLRALIAEGEASGICEGDAMQEILDELDAGAFDEPIGAAFEERTAA